MRGLRLTHRSVSMSFELFQRVILQTMVNNTHTHAHAYAHAHTHTHTHTHIHTHEFIIYQYIFIKVTKGTCSIHTSILMRQPHMLTVIRFSTTPICFMRSDNNEHPEVARHFVVTYQCSNTNNLADTTFKSLRDSSVRLCVCKQHKVLITSPVITVRILSFTNLRNQIRLD